MRILFVAIVLFVLASCSSSTLDTTFDPSLYKGYYLKMLKEKEISMQDIFLLNYSIVRQRNYYNYEVEGKTFGEILAQAKKLAQEGLPVKEQFEGVALPTSISATTSNEGFGLTQMGESSYQKKMFRFTTTFKNETDTPVAMEHSTFMFRGPFKDHLATAAFEVNCFLPPNGSVELGFMIDARAIRNNLVFDTNYEVERIDIDNLLASLTIELTGIELNVKKSEARNYDSCQNTATRRVPYKVLNYAQDLAKDWIVRGANGEAEALKLGKSQLDAPERDEIINYR